VFSSIPFGVCIEMLNYTHTHTHTHTHTVLKLRVFIPVHANVGTVLGSMTSCRWLHCRCFGDPYCVHIQGCMFVCCHVENVRNLHL